MPKTNIRSKALDWFAKNHPKETGEIYASKFYTPDESWSKTSVWFFNVPLPVIHAVPTTNINLLCENPGSESEFYCLKVSSSFLLNHLEKFDAPEKMNAACLYFSAEEKDKFREVRGKGAVEFLQFLT